MSKKAKKEYIPSPFKLEGQTEYQKKYSPHKLDDSWVLPKTKKNAKH